MPPFLTWKKSPAILLGVFLACAALPCHAQAAGAPDPTLDKAPPTAASSEPLKKVDVESAPVVFEGETLFMVKGAAGSFTVQERAQHTADLIKKMADDLFFDPDRLDVEEGEHVTRLSYHGTVLAALSDDEAALYGLTRTELVSSRVQVIKKAIHAYRAQRTPQAEGRALVFALLGALLLAVVLAFLRWLSKRWLARVEQRRAAGHCFRLQDRVILNPERFARIERRLVLGGAWILGALLVLAYLQGVFTLFPLTRSFALGLLWTILDPLKSLWEGFVGQIGNLVFIAVVLVITHYVLKAMKWLHQEAAQETINLPWVPSEWAMPVYKILRLIVLALVAVMLYPYIPGSSTGAFKGITLFMGVIVSLGSTGAAGQFIGGLVLMGMRAYRIGDRVEIAGVTGDVVQASLTFTRLRTIKNEEVTVPNSAVLQSRITNYSALAREGRLILHTTVTIGYDAPWRQVHDLLIRAARNAPGILAEPVPFVLQTSLDDSYVSYQINAFTDKANLIPQTYGALHQSIQDSFNEAGMEIMSPAYQALRDGNTVTVPEGQRPAGYVAPAFRIRSVPPQDPPG